MGRNRIRPCGDHRTHRNLPKGKMNAKKIALWMVVLSFAFLGMAFITSCAGFNNPSVCLKTDYGTLCYQLPDIEGLKK
jgi:hypothetical protein